MDADLQDDPDEIPALLNKLKEGYDLVSGWKRVRRDPWTKRFVSKIYNRFTSLFSGLNLHDFNCGLKGYRREDAKEKKSTMETYWVPGVNNLGTHGRWAFAEFTEVYRIEADFKAKVEQQFAAMLDAVAAITA